eukprot:TRINITY_DN10854_c0_g1_i1.p1 TRINITY_DN10854_c0_g1~~TRINITY_DN10854_c0_g1_i1.p1  ORF type:complete len:531 (-),score=76.73 TRINITY_DN10854_c0_g1_i1:21-1613(-)
MFCLFFFFVVASAIYDPAVFSNYLKYNRGPQCSARPEQIQMPLSYYAPADYWNTISPDQQVPKEREITEAEIVPACANQLIQPGPLNAYQFVTERYLTTVGLNIYDGAVHSIASALLGFTDMAIQYETTIISPGKTCQFGDIRGDAPCKGVINSGECTDPNQSGACGFCYGSGSNTDRTLPKTNAWSFRMISDYWLLQGTVDPRCPSIISGWIWNDYRPILGENAWAFLIGPLQVAFIKYGSATSIPDTDISITMGINFLASLPRMVTSVGGVSYSPKNNMGFQNSDGGFDVSTENNVSLLAGLKMLKYVLVQKNIHTDQFASLEYLIGNVTNFIKSSYSPSLGYFRQGGSYSASTGQFTWHTGSDTFAVDCQTWTISVIGPKTIDGWFGVGTTDMLWSNTKKIGGYNYLNWADSVDGLGFANNSDSQVFSGEWSLGGVNMLRILTQATGNSSYAAEGSSIRDNVSLQLTNIITVNQIQYTAINYANKRYWIPFGWWSNPLLSTASTSWAVFIDSNFNPLYFGGKYLSDY